MIRLYLDIDGVLNPYLKMGKMGDFDDFENHDIQFVSNNGWPPERQLAVRLSRKMVQELKNLDVEIVFNTTWCDYTASLEQLASLVDLEGTRQLYYDEVAGVRWRHYREQKALKLVEDVRKHGQPFIWVDDEAIDLPGSNYVKLNTDVEKRFIIPRSVTGITMENIDSMKQFIAANT